MTNLQKAGSILFVLIGLGFVLFPPWHIIEHVSSSTDGFPVAYGVEYQFLFMQPTAGTYAPWIAWDILCARLLAITMMLALWLLITQPAKACGTDSHNASVSSP